MGRPSRIQPGNTFGLLTALAPLRSVPKRGVVWQAQCSCGKLWEGPASKLVGLESCGCQKAERARQLGLAAIGRPGSRVAAVIEGAKFWWLTVLESLPGSIGDGKRFWICRCKCGNLVEARADRLAYHRTRSCGCWGIKYMNRELVRVKARCDAAVERQVQVTARQAELEAKLQERQARTATTLPTSGSVPSQ